jgi:septum formation protein
MVTENLQIVLASASPRRADILSKLGISFQQFPIHLDESQKDSEDPKLYAVRMANEKAEACAAHFPDHIILAADTIVVIDGEVLLKPHTEPEAREMLSRLSNSWHSVYTAMNLRDEKSAAFISESRVKFKKLSNRDIEWYVDTGEPWDKAGGYGIQGKASLFIEKFEGDYDTIVGLASRVLPEMFEQIGRDIYEFIS